MSYKTEFPEFDHETMPQIPQGFEDNSWHNDTCPSFHNSELSLALWIDHLNPKDREMPFKRFYLTRWNPDTDIEQSDIINTDNWTEIVTAIDKERSAY